MRYIKLFESFSKLEIGFKFKTTAVISRNGHFNHFGINEISATWKVIKEELKVNSEILDMNSLIKVDDQIIYSLTQEDSFGNRDDVQNNPISKSYWSKSK